MKSTMCERLHSPLIQQPAAVLPRLMAVLALVAAIMLPAITTPVANAQQNDASAGDAAQARLASGGKALVQIVVGENASEATRDSANVLAEHLSKITGGQFEVTQGDGSTGIAVGTPDDFPKLDVKSHLTATGVEGRQQYLIKSHDKGVWLIGQTDAAADYAVWDMLYRLGHRQFFPGETWEVVPNLPDASINVSTVQTPDYLYRRIWYGFGAWDYAAEPYRHWNRANRAPGNFTLNTGHAYDNIIRRNKQAFEEHPEYYALVDGQRKGSKMCTSNPGLQDLIVQYAKNYFEQNPQADSISIDPSDGGGWCECENCAKLGTPSDRALTLANRISEYLEKNLPNKFVAMYAYNEHSPPPNIQARERVIVNVATSFLRGGYSAPELTKAWHDKGVQRIGMREYYSVNTWDRDMPGRARGANIDYLSRTIPEYHRLGAVFMTSESSDNWGPNGLGYYLAVRMFWDVDAAKDIPALKQDFYDKAFGDAASTMKEFYERIDGSNKPIVSSPLIGRMYRLLDTARGQTNDPKVLARINDLILYTRYVELYQTYNMAGGKARQDAFEQLIRHAYQMRTTMMVHTKALYRDLDNRDRSVAIPAEAKWSVPEDRNPWKSSEPFTSQQLDTFIAQGIENNPLLAFEPISYPGDLVLASSKLQFADQPVLDADLRSRGSVRYYLWASQPGKLDMKAAGGLIAHYRNRGPTELRLYKDIVDIATLTDEHDVPNDGNTVDVSLKLPEPGVYVLTVSDGSDMSRIDLPAGMEPTIEAGIDSPRNLTGRFSGYFYVPKGTKVVGGHVSGGGPTIHDSTGQQVLKIGQAGYFHVDVAPGQDGKLWSTKNMRGRLMLMTVPPFLSQNPATLLLPDQIVNQDAGR